MFSSHFQILKVGKHKGKKKSEKKKGKPEDFGTTKEVDIKKKRYTN